MPTRPTTRPNLSKDYLAGTAPEEWMPLRPREAYADKGITLERGVEISEIDTKGRAVRTTDGRSFRFDRLLLATGADPIRLPVPGGDAPFVHLLRTMADCRRLIAAAGGAKRRRVVG
jgi:NAD(P)H-nitrite reductase large subunit